MNATGPWPAWCIVFWLGAAAAPAQLQTVSAEAPQACFGGAARPICVMWRNPEETCLKHTLRARILQASASTVMPCGEVPWKELEVLPGQTILESASLTFPAVNAETRFLVQWVTERNHIVGITETRVFPRDLLADLRPLLQGKPLGILDPLNQFKPVLAAVNVETIDLSDTSEFTGELAVLGPFESVQQFRETGARGWLSLAAKGRTLICVRPPGDAKDGLIPSFETVSLEKGRIVFVQPEMIRDLGQRPVSQLNLLRLVRLALSPEPTRWPD